MILDVVYNHLGPKDVDLWRFDGWSENDLGGIYFFNDWRAETPWGHSRPDYTRGEVRRFIVDNALMWLDEYRIDGLRVDGTVFIRTADFSGDRPIPEGYSLLQEINAEVRRRFPGRLLIAEDLRDNPEMTRPVEAGGAGFDTQWDGKFAYEIRRSVITPVDEERSMRCVAEAIAAKYNDDAFQRIIYSESHDEVANGKARVPYEINKDDATGWHAQKRSTLAAALVFTAPGIPMLFQGQEFLEGGWFRDDIPLDWDLSREFRGIVRLYRDLIALRLDRRGVTRGLRGQGVQVLRVDEERKVLAFRRWDRGGPGDDVVIVANFLHEPRRDYAIGFPAEGPWKVRFHSDWSGYSERFEGGEGGDATAEPGECDGLPCRGRDLDPALYGPDPVPGPQLTGGHRPCGAEPRPTGRRRRRRIDGRGASAGSGSRRGGAARRASVVGGMPRMYSRLDSHEPAECPAGSHLRQEITCDRQPDDHGGPRGRAPGGGTGRGRGGARVPATRPDRRG